MNTNHPEDLRDEHQQQDPRQALHHAFQRLLHHLIDRIIEIHTGYLVEDKTKRGDSSGRNDRRDQRRKRGSNVGRHRVRHFDLQPLTRLQPAVNLNRQNSNKHAEEQATGIRELAQQNIFDLAHLPIDHHLHGGWRDADKANHRQQPGEQRFNTVNPPKLNAYQENRTDIKEVKRGVV